MILKKTVNKKNQNFQKFPALVEKTVLIRKIVLFLGFKKTVLIRNPYY